MQAQCPPEAFNKFTFGQSCQGREPTFSEGARPVMTHKPEKTILQKSGPKTDEEPVPELQAQNIPVAGQGSDEIDAAGTLQPSQEKNTEPASLPKATENPAQSIRKKKNKGKRNP